MKAAPIIRAIRASNEAGKNPRIDHVLVHTGQHYDEVMSDRFFSDLGLPSPDVHLGVGSGSHATQTAEIMRKFEDVLLKERPAVVVVVGDVNSTLGCSLVSAKIAFDSTGSRPLIAHVEAGLRSFDRSMPEEINRIITDHISDLLFVTEDSGVKNLRNEGISTEKIHLVGNTMIDSLLAYQEKADASPVLEQLSLRKLPHNSGVTGSITRYALLTMHRPSNVDNRETFSNILKGLEELGTDCPIFFPVHPRTRRRIKEFDLGLGADTDCHINSGGDSPDARRGIILTNPLGYLDFLCLMKHSSMVITDSGGIQEETTCLGIPCVTVRENTERPVTVDIGTNIIAGTTKEGIAEAIRKQMNRKGASSVPKNWDGHAASRIVEILVRANSRTTSPVRQSEITQALA
jgi:UDP-N-acetylglucosamine 2-epimerase (non-hydrolysing)